MASESPPLGDKLGYSEAVMPRSRPRPTPARPHRRRRAAACFVFALVFGAGAETASAGPKGEHRELQRDADRGVTVVAGEADASAVVQNPANLGYLRGVEGVVDVSVQDLRSGMRGTGAGAFLAVPLPFQILALGVGIQQMWRGLPGADGDAQSLDATHGKFTFALAVPLMRWAPGLSLGLGVSALYSGANPFLRDGGVPLVDLALSYRANRHVSMALDVRSINHPTVSAEVSSEDALGNLVVDERTGRLPMVFDPEFALRPLGNSRLEFGVGMRIAPFGNPDLPAQMARPFILQPRVRVSAGLNGFRLYAEGERIAYQRFDTPEDALRFTLGLAVNAPHWGLAAGPNLAAGTGDQGAFVGGHGRIRVSQDRWEEAAELRPRRITRFDLARYGGERGVARLVDAIDELARRGAPALLLDTRGAGQAYAQIEEIREAVLRFRSAGGTAIAFVDGPSTRAYFLAASADRIYAHPNRDLNTLGVRLRSLYYGEILGRLGVRAEFVRIAEYKGSAESYARGEASEPVAAQRDLLLMDAYNHVLRTVARDRGQRPREVAAWIDEAPTVPERAVELGMVDALAWPDELDEALEDYFHRPVRIEKPDTTPVRADAWGPRAHVAVLHIDGDLVTGNSAFIPLLGTRLAGSETITAEIRKLRKDPNVKAVVVRISSRGGSVNAADDIARELDRTREVKPVLVSFGAVAASGGYYIATGGDYIFADAMTTTGSIGIFYPKFDLSEFLERFGVGVDLVGYGAHANMRSWFKPYSDEERDAAQASIRFSYDIFVDRVGRARSMTPEEVDGVARGRVWSGVRAMDVGLVDAYGGLREALMRARRVAGLPATAPAVHYPPPPGLIEQLRRLFGLQIPRLARVEAEGGRASARAGGLPGLERNPLVRAIGELPAALWMAEEPEAMALDVWDWRLE